MEKEILKTFKREHAFRDFIGNHPTFRKLVHELKKVAKSNLSVLLYGETGTGKGCCAEIIHQISDRNNCPFIPYNCGAGPESLFESQIFGHVKGAFTGAHKDRSGLVEEANHGVLFLDEINSLNCNAQVKLNYFLENGCYRRLGENRIRSSDVKIIAASNINLWQEMSKGRFREDLYFRLGEYEICVPPLRSRKSDIPLLVKYFFKKYNSDQTNLTSIMTKQLMDYNWPGNVRELENVIKRCIVDTPASVIDLLVRQENIKGIHHFEYESDLKKLPWKKAKKQIVSSFEKNYLVSVLKKYNGIVSQCARHAEVHAPDFWKLMRKYDLQGKDFRLYN